MITYVSYDEAVATVRSALEVANPWLASFTPATVLAAAATTQRFRKGRDAAGNVCLMVAASACCAENYVAAYTHHLFGDLQETCSIIANMAAAGMFVAHITDYKPTADTAVRLVKIVVPIMKICGFVAVPATAALTIHFDGLMSMVTAGMISGIFMLRTRAAGWGKTAAVAIGGALYTSLNYTYFDGVPCSQALMRIGLLTMVAAEFPNTLPPIHAVLVETKRKVKAFLTQLFLAKAAKEAA